MIQEIIEYIENINILYQLLAIFIIAFVPFLEAFVAVPVGILLGLPFIPIVILAIVGNWLSVMLVITFSTFLKSLFHKKESHDSDNFINRRFQKANKFFNKYGVPGISLIGPIIGTNHIGVLVCIIANANKKNIIIWQTISIFIWAIGTGILVNFGVKLL